MNPGISAYEIQNEGSGATNTEINDNLFSHIDFGPLKMYLDDDNKVVIAKCQKKAGINLRSVFDEETNRKARGFLSSDS